MSTMPCFHGEIRQISVPFEGKKVPYLELWLDQNNYV